MRGVKKLEEWPEAKMAPGLLLATAAFLGIQFERLTGIVTASYYGGKIVATPRLFLRYPVVR